MNRIIIALLLALAVRPACAELQAPTRTLQPVADAAMVVMDRGAKLEVLPNKRAMPQADVTSRVTIHRVVAASASSMIGPEQLGVVFNHARQEQGYISGEIAFQMKSGLKLPGLSSAMYPGLKKITNPEVYVVSARTPAEFIAVLKRLHARDDLAWVEPTVTYGPSQTSVTNQLTK
jgi:hypothetical protein